MLFRSGSSARLAIQEFRFTGLVSTFSLLVSSARLPILKPEETKYCGSSRHSLLVQDLEPKVPDCARALVY